MKSEPEQIAEEKGMCYKELITKYNIKNKSSLSYILNCR